MLVLSFCCRPSWSVPVLPSRHLSAPQQLPQSQNHRHLLPQLQLQLQHHHNLQQQQDITVCPAFASHHG